MDIPDDLINIITDLFRPPKRGLWGNTKNENSTNPSDNGDSKEDVDDNHTCDTILGFVKNIHSLDCNKYKDCESIENVDPDENHDSSNIEIEIVFYELYRSSALLELKGVSGCSNIICIGEIHPVM